MNNYQRMQLSKWTEEEDSRLEAAIREQTAAITEQRYTWSKISWSKVTACIFPRTDSQCLRRWAVLNPYEASLHKAARKVQKEDLISNFVDRESERPAIGPDDFVPLTELVPESVNLTKKGKRKQRLTEEHKGKEISSEHAPKRRSRRHIKESHKWSNKICSLTNNDDDVGLSKKKRVKRKSRSTDDERTPLSQDHLLSFPDTALMSITNGEEVRALSKDKLKKKNASRKQKR